MGDRLANKLIVADADHPAWRENRCFDPALERLGFGQALYVGLAREARRRGIEVTTADVYRAMSRPPQRVACLTSGYTADTDALLASGAQPAICHSLELPLVAHKFYHSLARYAGRFKHNYQFRGTQPRLAGSSTVFHPLYFPIETRALLPLRAWHRRDYLVLINSNKRAGQFRPTNLLELRRLAIIAARFQLWRLFDPWLRVPELYVDRIRAIGYFGRRAGFRLYGHGWDKPISGFGRAYHQAALKVYAGAIAPGAPPKRAVMNGFRFAICFENCAFPGYVTEKLFDCFLAGCVPIYLGAPDITDFVPAQTFIDFRRFGSWAELERYTRDLSEAEAQCYLDAARDFLASSEFDKFGAENLAREMVDRLEEALQ